MIRPGTPYAHVTSEQAAAHDAQPPYKPESRKAARHRRHNTGMPRIVHQGWVHFPRLIAQPPEPEPAPPTLWQRIKSYVSG